MAKPAVPFVDGAVSSNDCTRIGFRRYGRGPGIVLVQGTIGTTRDFHDLATHLARDFTVLVPERRGRPSSPRPFSPDHVIARDVADLAAVLAHADADILFGLSSGAVIALEAARVLPAIRRLVLFEPPLHVSPRRMRLDLVARFHRDVERGDIPGAMHSALIASGLAPFALRITPRWLVRIALAAVLRLDTWRATPGRAPLCDLVPTMRNDFSVVSSMQGRLERFATVTADMLLLSCARSPAYLRKACDALHAILASSRPVEFARLDHSGPWNADRGGRPEIVARAIRGFVPDGDGSDSGREPAR